MRLEEQILERVGNWERLSRWEKAELGRDLRRAGLSYGEIMSLIDVKKSTLATWCRDVDLTEEQIEKIKQRTGSIQGIPRDTNRTRRVEIERIRVEAIQQSHDVIHDPIWAAGVALYWGEGLKTQSQMGMANADPHVLRFFMRWTLDYHRKEHGFRAKLNLHAGNDETGARVWWAEELGLRLDDFTKTYIKPDGTGHRKNHLVHGVCLVRVRKSADAFHRTMAWVEFMQGELGTILPTGR